MWLQNTSNELLIQDSNRPWTWNKNITNIPDVAIEFLKGKQPSLESDKYVPASIPDIHDNQFT